MDTVAVEAPTPTAASARASGPSAGPARLAHLPALDGIRALAVIAVLCFHGLLEYDRGGWAGGGFIGVDVFFVLSGFLITALLLREHEDAGTIGLGRFWSRRVRRLLPALLLMLVGVAAYAAFVASPTQLGELRAQGLATLLYGQN